MDLFGPPTYDSLGGKKYCLVIVDDYTRYCWTFYLKRKSETQKIFIDFATLVQCQYDSKILAIRSDNGTEFKNYTMDDFLSGEGIQHQYSAAYTPQQNGVAERKNRTLIDMARTMLAEFRSPYNFWAEAINTACHYSNRLFFRPLMKKTPYELLIGKKPNVSYFRVFGCKCHVYIKGCPIAKFESRTFDGIFVGYAANSHTYRVYNISTGCVEESMNVEFVEDNGSQAEHIDHDNVGDVPPPQAIRTMGIGELIPIEEPIMDTQEEGTSSTQVEPSTSTIDQQAIQEQDHDSHPHEQDNGQDPPNSSGNQEHDEPPSPRTPLRVDHEQDEGNDEDVRVGETIGQAIERRVIRRASTLDHLQHFKENILGSIRKGVSTRNQLSNFCGHVSCLSSLEPLKVYDALEDMDWVAAMHEELNNFGCSLWCRLL